MASEWYYAHDGQSVGPVSLEELQRLAESGELQRADLVWTAPMAQWEEAGGFDELFPSLVETPSSFEPVAPVPGGPPVPVAPVAPPPGGRQYQGRAAQAGDQGGRQGRGGRGGYGGRRPTGIPPIVLVGFILSIVGCVLCWCGAPIALVGLILCLVGLGEAKRRQEGVGLAIAGIVIGILGILVGIGMVVVGVLSDGSQFNF